MLTLRNPGLKNLNCFCRPGGFWEGSGGLREASGGILGGGFAPPDPHTGWYVHLKRFFQILTFIVSSFLGRFFVIFVIFGQRCAPTTRVHVKAVDADGDDANGDDANRYREQVP